MQHIKIGDIFKLSCLKLYHKYINRMLPSFFNNIFTMNTDIHSYETRNRDNLHYFPYNRESASKRIRHSMPNLINLLSADVMLKINSMALKQFVSFYKSITIASYDVMYVVTTEAFFTISVHNARTPLWVCARRCMYTCVRVYVYV